MKPELPPTVWTEPVDGSELAREKLSKVKKAGAPDWPAAPDPFPFPAAPVAQVPEWQQPPPPGEWCRNGLKSAGEPPLACCPLSCGRCGEAGCDRLPGGAEACCRGSIYTAGTFCSELCDLG